MIFVDYLKSGHFIDAPHAKAIGMGMVDVSPSRGVLKVDWREDLVGDAATGVIAGGVVTALLDHVCGLAVMASLTELAQPATLDLRIDYLRPAERGKTLFAAAHCYKTTRSVAFVRASAYEDDPDHLVATAQGTFILNRREDRRREDRP